MAGDVGQVRSKAAPSRMRVSAALALGWGRVSAGNKDEFAHTVGLHPKSVGRALAETHLPEADHVLASLLFDPTALDEVLALYGFRLVPTDGERGDDMALAVGLSGGVAEFLKRIADGEICHVDVLALAKVFRPLIPQMQGIVDNADKLRGVR